MIPSVTYLSQKEAGAQPALQDGSLAALQQPGADGT